MRIGVISEGHADRAVIENLIVGLTGLDSVDIEPLRPQYNYDETDKAVLDPKTFSSWSVVMQECKEREMIDGFLEIEGQDFIAIHIDTAEADQYGISRPPKDNNYCMNLRNLVIQEMIKWFGEDISDSILYAIAIEEIDAWLLTIYDNRDTTTTATPKEKLQRILGKAKPKINLASNYDNYLKLSKPFSKKKDINRGQFLERNCSLEAFYEEILQKVVPKLK